MAGKPPAAIGDNLTQVRANREKALFSHIWNFAREQGLPKSPNPCTGIRGFREQGRDVVISDEVVERMFAHASQPRQFALRLAHHTGQRPADVLRMSESHISQGLLHARQGKTAAKLRIEVSGALAELIAEIQAYKSQFKVRALSLLVNEAGLSMSQHMLRDRFDAAREAAGIPKAEFQFRDLRATAKTALAEAVGIQEAQALLGHTTEGLTAHYIRHKIGEKVKLLR